MEDVNRDEEATIFRPSTGKPEAEFKPLSTEGTRITVVTGRGIRL
jgi:hypothetical protein